MLPTPSLVQSVFKAVSARLSESSSIKVVLLEGLEPSKAPGLSRLAVPIYLSHKSIWYRRTESNGVLLIFIQPQ